MGPDPSVARGEEKTLYVIANAHLDTQWRWTIQETIARHLPNTLKRNFELFDKYPDYTFSFEGAFRYMLFKEYYPEEYERLKLYIAKGRWCVAGGFVDSCDVNIPSPESLVRNILYGNGFFKEEFDKTSCDVFLPDCFGFGYALPTVAAHCGLKGFSAMRVAGGGAKPIPFRVGVWEGVDGSSIVAALAPGKYNGPIESDLSLDETWLSRIDSLGEQSGVFVDYKYFGVGDTGGAPDEESVQWLMKSMQGTGPIRVLGAGSDQMFRDLTTEEIEKLPRYRGELQLTALDTGCYTSQAAMKRWNRKNELLADSAERASVAADWLGGARYPKEKLTEAWVRFLWHQFHDDLTGTSIPEAYEFSWNDEIISLNQFSEVLTNAVGATARALDTRARGIPVVAFNPLSMDREDVVKASVSFPKGSPNSVRVYDGKGKEVLSQILCIEEDRVDLIFLARVPSVGFAVFDVRASEAPCSIQTDLEVTDCSLENQRYRMLLDDDGDVSSIWDKELDRELLKAPLNLQMLDQPKGSAWIIRHCDLSAEPRSCVGRPVEVSVAESGPLRAALSVRREAEGSVFVQNISLGSGAAGSRVDFDTRIDWNSRGTLLKASFLLSASNEMATYDLGLGAIERGNNTSKLYEVPAQQWADLTDANREFGIAIMNDCKYGWDKPDDNTLRLTLLHAPGFEERYPDQSTQDMGSHEFLYSLFAHRGDWKKGSVVWEAARLNQPVLAFQTAKRDGPLGKTFSLLRIDNPGVALQALKKAEHGDEIVLRLREIEGESVKDARVSFPSKIVEAREINGAEEEVRLARVKRGKLVVDLTPCQLRTFAVKISDPRDKLSLPECRPLDLPYDVDVTSLDNDVLVFPRASAQLTLQL